MPNPNCEPVSNSHIVHVVSIDEVPTNLLSTADQSKDVSGAQNSYKILLYGFYQVSEKSGTKFHENDCQRVL